jgi:hypothetical protein
MRYGQFPDALSKLVPELLQEMPVDWEVGQPLRYRLDETNSYTLYSVGSNGKDDGGDATPDPKVPGGWTGRDQVWPKLVRWKGEVTSK